MRAQQRPVIEARTYACSEGWCAVKKVFGPASDWFARRLASVVVAAVATVGVSIGPSARAFEYSGSNGPAFWSQEPGAEACAGAEVTARQSPIDITNPIIDQSLDELDLQFGSVPLRLVNDGHTIEVDYSAESEAGTLFFDNTPFTLTHFDFHTLSEHTVGGERALMEMHATFRDETGTRQAVVALLFRLGNENPFLQLMIDAGLPERKDAVVVADGISINLADGITDPAKYYTYEGSLTTPPCSETVTWIVLKDVAEMSADQIAAFRHVLGNNFRPLQALNQRTIRTTTQGGRGRGRNGRATN